MASYSAGSATLEIVPSLRGLQRKMRTELRSVNEELKVQLVPGDINAFATKLSAELAKVQASVDIKLNIDGEVGALSRLKGVSAELDKLNGKDIKLNVEITGDADFAGIARLKGVSKELDALDGKDVKAKIDIQGDLSALAGLAELNRELDKFGRKDVTAKVHVDKDSSARKQMSSLGSSLGSLGSAFGVLGKLVPSPKIAAVGLSAGAAIPAVLGLAAALGEASGALLVLPAAGAAGAVAFGSLKIATSGFGDALKNIGDPEKFAESLAKLSPNARAAATAVQGLKPPFDDLKRTLQDTLFNGIGPQITDLGSRLIGTLGPAFTSVAASANTALRGVMADLASVRGQADLGLVAGNSATAFGNLTGALQPLVGALRDVIAVGSDFLPGLTAGAQSAAQGFADMVSRARESGQLQGIIQGGLDALKQLGAIAGNVGSAIGGIFSAANATGGGFLNNLTLITQKISDVINSVAGQTALQQFFQAGATAIGAVGDILTALAPTLAVVMSALNQAIQAIAPAIGPLAAALGTVIQAVAPLLPVIGELVATIASGLAPVLTSVAPLVGEIAQQLGGALGQAVQALMPALQPLVQAFLLLVQAVVPVLPIAAQLLSIFVQVASGILVALLPSIGQIVQALADALMPLLPPLLAAFQQIFPVLAQVGVVIANAVVTAIQALAPLLPPLINAVLALITAFLPLLPVIADLAVQLIPPLVQILQTLIPIVTQVILAITPWINQLIALLVPAIQMAGDTVRNIFQFIADFITSTVETVKGIFTALQDALAAVGQFFSDTWTNVIQPAWNAIGDGIRWVYDNVVQPAFNALQGGLDTLKGWFNSTVDNIGSMWDRLKEIVAAPIRFIVDTVYNKGIRAAWGKVAGWLDLPELEEVPLTFATGGAVAGAGTGTSDSINARLSNGEHVWTAKEVEAAGGQGAMYAMRQGVLKGNPAQFSAGGMVDLKTVIPAFAGGGEVTWPAMWDIAQGMAPGVVMTSNYRPGGPYHGTNQAIDLSFPGDPPAQLNALSNAIAESFPNSTELINLGGSNIKNGQFLSDGGFGVYGAGTMSEHNNHVHWANDQSSNFSGIAQAIGSVGRSIGGAISSAYHALVGAAFDGIMDPIGNAIPEFGGGAVGQLPKQSFGKMKDSVRGFLLGKADDKDKAGHPNMGGGSGAIPTGDHLALIDAALSANGIPQAEWPKWEAGMDTLITRESGWNSGAVNNWDINAANGVPSGGLTQTIGPTYQAYRNPALVDNMFDPVSNIAASINYINSRYGGIENVQQANPNLPPMGYDNGGWLPPGASTVYNGLGTPEPVFTTRQWQDIRANVNTGDGGGSKVIAGTNVADGATIVIGDWDAHERANRQSANLLAAQQGI